MAEGGPLVQGGDPGSSTTDPGHHCFHAPLCAAARGGGTVLGVMGVQSTSTRSHDSPLLIVPLSAIGQGQPCLRGQGQYPLLITGGVSPQTKQQLSSLLAALQGGAGCRQVQTTADPWGAGAEGEPMARMCSAAGFRPRSRAGRAQPQKPKKALSERGSLNPRLSSSGSACLGGGSAGPCPAPVPAPAHPLNRDWLQLTVCAEGREGKACGREEVIECNQIWKVCLCWVGVGRHCKLGAQRPRLGPE